MNEEQAARLGAEAMLQMLLDLRGQGTNQQALDHIVSRMQDVYGSVPTQLAIATERALQE